MTDFSLTSSFASEIKNENYNNASKMTPLTATHRNDATIVTVILFVLCFLGLFGNGKVIWTLGFHMKRNSFSIYVLNLAVADSGVLIMLVLKQIPQFFCPKMFQISFVFLLLCFVLYNISQLLLISISVDRCVSVLFPIWHRCHQTPKLSRIVCVITWVLPFLYFALEMVVKLPKAFLWFQLIFSSISYLVMITSTLILLVKIEQLQLKRKKALRLTLLALMFFIVFRLPLSILSIINYTEFKNEPNYQTIIRNMMMEASKKITILVLLSNICIAINSTINPILYFLAGRNKEDRSRLIMKLALQRIFRNEEDAKEDEMQPDEI